MTRRSVIAAYEEKKPLWFATTTLRVAKVLAYMAGGNEVTVRVLGSSRVIQHVLTAAGQVFRTQDRVLVAHVPGQSHWIAICKVQTTDEHGLSAGEVAEEQDLHPPSDLTVAGYSGIVVATWNAWAGDTICFEVESNTTASATGADMLYTRGSVFVRVRSLRYDVKEDQAFYSGWTSWGSASSAAVATQDSVDDLRETIESWIEHQDWTWSKHVEGEL